MVICTLCLWTVRCSPLQVALFVRWIQNVWEQNKNSGDSDTFLQQFEDIYEYAFPFFNAGFCRPQHINWIELNWGLTQQKTTGRPFLFSLSHMSITMERCFFGDRCQRWPCISLAAAITQSYYANCDGFLENIGGRLLSHSHKHTDAGIWKLVSVLVDISVVSLRQFKIVWIDNKYYCMDLIEFICNFRHIG